MSLLPMRAQARANLFGSLGKIAATSALAFFLGSEDKTVRHILELLAEKLGQLLGKERERACETLSGMMTLLRNADVVTVLPVIEGD